MRQLVLAAFVLLSTLSYAQRLPRGAYHPVRERTFDILHYKAHLEFEFAKGRVLGEATISLTPLLPMDSLTLDAYYLTVKSVRNQKGNAPLLFRASGKSLSIQTPRTLPGDTLKLTIVYEATPRAGMYIRLDTATKKYFVHTYGEGGLHANWLPIYNDVNDNFSTEMVITVPRSYSAISNGRLVETTMRREGFTTYHWLQTLPHSNYLISVYIGDYEEGKLPPAFGTIPLSYWVPRGRLQEGAFAFRNTTRMVEYFSGLFNYRYPWDKYDQIAVPDYSIGAMEHTGVTGHRICVLRDSTAPLEFGPPVLTEYANDWSAEATISHELAHHWFGNSLTCRNLSYLWLNESFASYCMMLWDEESVGRDQLLFDVHLAKKHYFDYVKKKHMIRPLEYHNFDNPDVIYNTEHTYLKGAVVLHMMRTVLGDEQFFRALSHYLHKHEFGNVVSNDLLIAIQEATGKNLDWFFGNWVTGGGHPTLEVKYKYIPEKKVIDLSIQQVQPFVEGQGLFTLPVPVTIVTSKSKRVETIWVKSESEHYVFASDDKPLMVSVDGEGSLVAEIVFEKTADELAYQVSHDALTGRLRAMRQLAEQYPTHPITVNTLSSVIAKPVFWADAAEAAELLGVVRTDDALRVVRQALAASDYRVRKAAVLAMTGFGANASEMLKEIVQNDRSTDVVATAILALSKVDKESAAFIKQQMTRQSWYDEITIACLKAFATLKDPTLIDVIKPYTGGAHNQYVREAALEAWDASAPQDKELDRTLIVLARGSTLRLHQKAIEMLGDRYVRASMPLLEEIARLDFDANLTSGAKDALEKIRRVHGVK